MDAFRGVAYSMFHQEIVILSAAKDLLFAQGAIAL